jgi:hypothetical protein
VIADSILPSIANLPAADSSAAVGWLFVALGVLFLGIEAAGRVYDRFKGKKPHSLDLQTFTTKKDHEALSQRVDKVEAEHNFQTHATQRALGRIEGKLDIIDKSNSH